MRRKVIVFDLDDTLYKEVDFLKSAYFEIASWIELHYNKTGVYDFMFSCYMQKKNTFLCINQEYNLNIEIDILLRMYRAHFPYLTLSEEVQSMLNSLVAENMIIGIITDGRERTQLNKIKALGLDKYISLANCVISESFGYSKPSQEAFLFFQHKYGMADYYYIGDNTQKDFIAPNSLGWTTICVLDDGRNIHKQQPVSGEMKPTYEIGIFSKLYQYIIC